MPEKHTILGGKVHVYKRENSSVWQCSTYLGGKNRRMSTKEDSLSRAKEIAEDWYLGLRGKLRNGEIKTEKTFSEASEQFLREYEIITQGQRSAYYVKQHQLRSRVHLVPFFGDMGLSEITAGQVQEYRIHRLQEAVKKYGKPPARSTIHQEIVCLRQTLKTAVRHGWLDHLPDLIDRQACDLAAVIGAHLRERGSGAARLLSGRRQIASEPAITIGPEQTGVDIDIAIAPEAGAVAPERVVIDVVIGEWPEQRPDPAKSAVGVPPPPSMRAAVPADDGSARGKLSSRGGI